MSASNKNNYQDDEMVTKNVDFDLLCNYKRLKENITMFTSHNQNPAYNFINYVFYYNIKHYIEIHIVTLIQNIEYEFTQIENTNNQNEIQASAVNIMKKFVTITEKYKEAQQIFLNLTKPNSNTCVISNIIEIKEKFRAYNSEENINVNFPSLLSCFETLESEIRKIQLKAERELRYYEGKSDSVMEGIHYWTIGWFAWSYNWCRYKTKVNAYRSFLTVFIDPLRTYISSRRRDISTVKIHFERLVKCLEKCQEKFPDDLDAENPFGEGDSTELINSNLKEIYKVFKIINPTTGTIYSCLKVPDSGDNMN